jgi:hypothetical protein
MSKEKKVKKQLVTAVLLTSLAGLATPALAQSTAPYPSYGFEQEFAGILKKGDIQIDLVGGGITPWADNGIRIGALGGELQLIYGPAGGIGYKYGFNRHMAAYGRLFTTSGGGTSYTNFSAGFSYTGKSGALLYNGNGELYSDGAGGQTYTFAKGAAFYSLPASKKMSGNMALGAELNMQLSPSPTSTNLFLGLRWMPKPKILIDLGAASSTGGTTTFATPAFFRFNLTL